jgi:hypothetical protein
MGVEAHEACPGIAAGRPQIKPPLIARLIAFGVHAIGTSLRDLSASARSARPMNTALVHMSRMTSGLCADRIGHL